MNRNGMAVLYILYIYMFLCWDDDCVCLENK